MNLLFSSLKKLLKLLVFYFLLLSLSGMVYFFLVSKDKLNSIFGPSREIEDYPPPQVFQKSKKLENPTIVSQDGAFYYYTDSSGTRKTAYARASVSTLSERTILFTNEGSTSSLPVPDTASIRLHLFTPGRVLLEQQDIKYEDIQVNDKFIYYFDYMGIPGDVFILIERYEK